MQSPSSYQPALVQQGNKYEHHVDPNAVQLVQHTAVSIVPLPPPPRDHIIWSIFSLAYYNPCCLGLLALYFSVKSRDRKAAGDLKSAGEYGFTARNLNIAALVLLIIATIILIACYSAIMAYMARLFHG